MSSRKYPDQEGMASHQRRADRCHAETCKRHAADPLTQNAALKHLRIGHKAMHEVYTSSRGRHQRVEATGAMPAVTTQSKMHLVLVQG